MNYTRGGWKKYTLWSFWTINSRFWFFFFKKKKNDTFECFESVMGKSASMNFLFVVNEVGHQGDGDLPADF